MPKETFINLITEKQEKVMRAAISEFSNHGFEKANIGIIAKNAGVAKGSIYQYFENKKELFLYSVQWATNLLMEKYAKDFTAYTQEFELFNFYYKNARTIWLQMREEREIVIFIQDVILGKYSSLTDESMEYMLKYSDEILLRQIQNGKKNGYIRNDIDDNTICLYMTGVSIKFKENMMRRARAAGADIVDDDFEVFEKEITDMIELLKNGIAVNSQS